MAPFYTAGRGGAGVYLLNTYDLPSRPLYNLTALTLHESAPGHAFQIPIAMEHKDQPAFRQLTYISAYGEGWALYCEQLGGEMGMYDTPYDRFGMLGYQIWRAARLVVDTGIHSQGWTRQQAIDYFRQYTALPEREIATEIDRYITWPGQALSYYLGERAILEARAKAEKALGEHFNIRAFHDVVLAARLRALADAAGAHRSLYRGAGPRSVPRHGVGRTLGLTYGGCNFPSVSQRRGYETLDVAGGDRCGAGDGDRSVGQRREPDQQSAGKDEGVQRRRDDEVPER